MHPLEEEILRRALVRGGLRLLRPNDALEVLRFCSEAGVRLLGIDAVTVTTTHTQPIMELSRDFSEATCSRAYAEACRVVSENSSTENLMFELVVDYG